MRAKAVILLTVLILQRCSANETTADQMNARRTELPDPEPWRYAANR